MLPIEAPDNQDNIWSRIYFFGTGRADCMGLGGMNCVRRDQVEWFKQVSEDIPLDESTRGNGIAFMQHALQEHMMLVNDYPVRGQKRDYSTCQAVNSGLFAQMVMSGTMQWVSAGGDHSTDFYGKYAGINLSYGRKTGTGSYGPKFSQSGARVFELEFDEEPGKVEIETWIRQKDGTIDNQDEENRPAALSWLRSDHCFGSEQVTTFYDPQRNHNENFWLPNFIS